ncbi:hypothetical protein COCOBI_06-6410 [Coccomyxa sp. Obi]|nr:hypothetical protein COCOBI_06-6410 [Coccomyxa sp. Obi]
MAESIHPIRMDEKKGRLAWQIGKLLVISLAAGEAPPEMPEQALLYAELSVAPKGELAAPVRALRYVPGAKSGGHSSLLVLGGQDAEQPDVLSMLPLQGPSEEAEGPHALPWFGAVQGFALVPPEGSFGSGSASGEMAALIVLSEGGQLMVHDLRTLQPSPLSLPFQELPPVTASAFAPGELPLGEDADHFPHAVSVAALRATHGATVADSPERGVPRRWRWVLSGGRPARGPVPSVPPTGPPTTGDEYLGEEQTVTEQPSQQPRPGAPSLYLTGHRDGRVRVWDTTAEVPSLLATVPFDAGGAGGKLRPVSAMQVCVASGWLVVAHEKGEVRVYQFSPHAQDVTCIHIDNSSKGPPERSTARQPAGYQAVLRANLHEAAVSAVCIASKAGLVALGDASGDLSGLNLARPAVEFYKHLSDQPIATAEFGLHNFVPVKSSSDRRRDLADTPVEARLSLYVGTADCALTVLDARHGEPLGIGRDTWLRPKHPDAALGLALLDAAGCPLRAPAGPGLLPWAGNTRAAAAPEKPAAAPAPVGAADNNCGYELPFVLLGKPMVEEASVGSPHAAHMLRHITEEARPSAAAAAADPGEVAAAAASSDNGHISPFAANPPAQPLQTIAARAAEDVAAPVPSGPEPGTPQRLQERGASVKGDSDSDGETPAQLSADEAEDDHDDLLAAAAAAVEAQQKEAVKAGRKKFGLLGRSAAAALQKAVPRHSEDEHGHVVSSHTAKSGLGRWVRRGSENSPGISPRPSASADEKEHREAGAKHISTKRSAETKTHSATTLKPAASKEAPTTPVAFPSSAARTPQAESAGPLPAVAAVADAPEPTAQQLDLATAHDAPPSAAAAAASVTDEAPMRAPVSMQTVSHVVLASSGSLRLYAGDNLRTADRTTLKKAALDGQFGFAGAFCSSRGPGVACISPEGILKVYTLPSLELILAQRLEEGLTFPWAWNIDTAHLSRLCAVDPQGELALVGAHGDLARLGLVEGTPSPSPVAQLYDWDLATAALAAAHAVSRELRAAAVPAPSSFQPPPPPQPLPAPALQRPECAEGTRGSEEVGGKRGLGGFLHSGLDRFGKEIMAARNPFINERAAQRQPPTLAAVFANASQPDSPGLPSQEQPFHSAMDREESGESLEGALRSAAAAAREPRALPQHSDSADAARAELFAGQGQEAGTSDRGSRALWGAGDDARDDGGRAELLRGARVPRSTGGGGSGGPPALGVAPPGTRTAEEIKAAYGRSTHARRAEGVGGIAEENRQRLAERGEKLRSLQDKTDRMQADAEDFASMARAIRDREANKKWWQL